ncbi:MAG: 4-hydroxybenzoate octaprenyltransferase [Clostridiaceae bacterium]|jgi:geranylgeranylglycerol-phosphate geranylgeranyltransferase|nr:4-hydroxybenzoate octaprenyltransferase [Clostridiaceae bacterium]
MINCRKIKGLIELLRPELPFAAGICVIIGEIIAFGRFPSFLKLFLGFVWGFFISSPAMIMNDYFDIEVDRVNSPHRPLPSALISPTTAINLAIFTTLMGLATSAFINKSAILLYIIFWIVGFLYNWKLKEMGLFGNLLVSCSVAITFIVGGIVVGKPWNEAVWTFSLIVFLFDLGEEIASDVMDIEGDKKRNVKSLAILIGGKNALRISASLFLLVIILSFRPALWNLLGTSYLLIITITDIMILIFEIKLLKCRTIKAGRFYIRAIYFSAIFGMLAIIISKIWEIRT